ncbi:MAG: crossover junction endodeoxyribonuclease RuvC [Armatimonadetes bacterium]|nr:crossover junction endodeoxyribonuclease RuvC [Armatimonadota bacterium]
MITALGIDPGLAETGYAVLSGGAGGFVLRDAGILHTAARDGLATRLADLHRDLAKVLDEYPCDMMVVEDLYAFGRSPRTAIVMGHARGIILLAATLRSTPVVPLPPAAVKRALVGSGQASKAQIQRMVEHLVALPRPVSDHVADAVALALVGLSRRGVPLVRAPGEGSAPRAGRFLPRAGRITRVPR